MTRAHSPDSHSELDGETDDDDDDDDVDSCLVWFDYLSRLFGQR